MIYFSETPVKTWQPNLIMLDLEDDLGHIYVSRNTYDQAVLISDRFNHDTDLVNQKLGLEISQEDIESYMVAVLPSPINILAPYYNMIDKSVKLSVENLKQTIGVLSYLSMSLDLNMILKVPFEVRANLIFTKSILLDYQGHFDDFNFRISLDERHINTERDRSYSSTNRVKRSEQEDFELEPVETKEEEFDETKFFADLGWDEMVIPKINTDDTPSTSSTPNLATVTNITTVSNSSSTEVAAPENPYEEIAKRFVN